MLATAVTGFRSCLYFSRLRFYHVDVNAVPYKLVSRAGVTVMNLPLLVNSLFSKILWVSLLLI